MNTQISIAIAGGGIGGLAAERHWSVRDRERARQGTSRSRSGLRARSAVVHQPAQQLMLLAAGGTSRAGFSAKNPVG